MGLEEEILGLIREAGRVGITAGQLARRLGRSRATISHYLWILRKRGLVDRVGRNLWVIQENPDPFNIPLEEFMRLDLERHGELQRAAYEACRELVEEAFRRGARQVIVCDSRIVYETEDPADLPPGLIEYYIRKFGKPCYVFVADDAVEESAWSPVSRDDYYPTIRIYLGRGDWSIERAVAGGVSLEADFDTGNPFYKIFPGQVGYKLFGKPRAYEIRLGRHLGIQYRFFARNAVIASRDMRGEVRGLVEPARFVLSWATSPLLLANPNRSGFLGRDVLFKLSMAVTLDPVKRSTVIEFC